jgi:peptide/nickel transport system permease protein
MPYFVIGMPLIIIFAAGLGWFPTSGMTTPGGTRRRRVHPGLGHHLVLPLTAVALGLDRRVLDPHALVDHRDALRGLHHDRPGEGPADCPDPRSHAFPERPAADGHADRDQPRLRRGGAITAEIVFNWPGLGTAHGAGAGRPRLPALQAIFLLIAVSVVFANFAADIVYGYLDPGVRE